MKETKNLTDLVAIKAYSDPFRMMILKSYFKINRPATVKQISDEMKEVPAKIHYHVKKMVASGILKLCFTKEVNGITAKFYEPCAKSFNIVHDKIRQHEQDFLNDQNSELNFMGVFDDHKQIAFDAMSAPTTPDPFVMASELFLSSQEYKDLTAYIEQLHLKSQRKSSKKKQFKFLTSISQVNYTESV